MRVSGTVVFYHKSGDCFLHDGTIGIYIALKPPAPPPPLGSYVEVEGITLKGMYAPSIESHQLRILREGALPQARPVTYEELVAGNADCDWIEARGIVRHAYWYGNILNLKLSLGGGKVRVSVYDHPPRDADSLVDAVIRLRGAVGGSFTQRRQLAGPHLFANGAESITIEQPSPIDPFGAAPRSIDSLLQFRGEKTDGHRVKVRGVVIYVSQDEAIYVRDATGALRIQTNGKAGVAAGDTIEALGFPEMGVYTPVLQDALIHPVGMPQVLDPLPITSLEFLRGLHDADLISLDAILIDSFRTEDDQIFVMQSGDVVFNAQCAIKKEDRRLPPIPNGSRLLLAGVGLVDSVSERHGTLSPRSFKLLVRSPGDIRVLATPSWWTSSRLLGALAVAAAAIVAVLAWVLVLRRRLHGQKAIIQEKLQREAALEERARLAREFHDSLQQDLVGLTLQLDTVALQLPDAPTVAGKSLDVARQIIRRSLEETHRAVWDLRSKALETGSLSEALSSVIQPLTENEGVETRITVSGKPVPLPEWAEHHLLRIGQEGVSNAIKHGHAKKIAVTFNYNCDELNFSLEDDGCGFDPAAQAAEGHFGLLGAKERVQKLGGKIQFESAPGEGTRLKVSIPYCLPDSL